MKDLYEFLSKMTLLQKCALLSGKDVFTTRDFPKIGIPGLYLSDGPNGVRKQAGSSDHLGLNPSETAVCFPTASAMACSWNEELLEEVGSALGQEAAYYGVGVLLGPGLNIKRNPLCGRNFEYYSEDPYLSGKMAAAMIRGMQNSGISACPKHFAVNSQETRRMVSDSIVDERTFREIYLTGFEIAVKEGDPRCIMSSYNLINGVYANENEYLLKDILRDEWGYDGMVVTDWGGSNDHALGVKNGSSLEMPTPGNDSVRELMDSVKKGLVSETDIDERALEVLKIIFETREAVDRKPTADFEKHHELCRRTAVECTVLLKNEDGILPLKPGRSIAVIGDFAKVPRYQGAGSSHVNSWKEEDLLSELTGTDLTIIGYEPGFDRHGSSNDELKTRAVELAEKADMVLMCMGLDEIRESEGVDREDMLVADNQIELIKALHDVNKHIAVVFFAGSAVESSWSEYCEGLILAGLSGEAGAGGLSDVLTGKMNPSGRLTETWPVCYEDVPSSAHFGGEKNQIQYREGLYVGYRYFLSAGRKVAYPFGFGLSYTSFTYSDLKLNSGSVVFNVTNTGTMDGACVAELYISKKSGKVFSPAAELKGFKKIALKAGETKSANIMLDEYAFRYYDPSDKCWKKESGTYEIVIGSYAGDRALVREISVESDDKVPAWAEDPRLGPYMSAKVSRVGDDSFEALLMHPIPTETVKIDRNITFGELGSTRSPLAWFTAAVLRNRLRSAESKGITDLNLIFIYNMPIRALAKMTSGIVSMGMVDAIVMELRGFWIIGILKLIYEFFRNLICNKITERQLES